MPAVKYLKYSSCSDFNRSIFESLADTDWLRSLPELQFRSSCSLIGLLEIQPEIWNSMGEIPDGELQGDENRAEWRGKVTSRLGMIDLKRFLLQYSEGSGRYLSD